MTSDKRDRATWVVKIGGRLCEDRDGRVSLARACQALPHRLVLVHGGGDAVTRLQSTLGVEPRFVEGRRVTDSDDLATVEMVLSGQVNKSLVRAISNAGRPAVGLSGCDAGLVRCDLVPGLGRVGTPSTTDVQFLRLALEAGYTPVVSPVAIGPDGEPVNVNADEMAAALAGALSADQLLLLSDVEGVRVEDRWAQTIAYQDVESLVAAGEATRGMIPKLRAAAAAVEAGVREVRIGGFSSGGLQEVLGTRVVRATERAAARAMTRGGAVHG
jgi:acetylglutamate kinase